MLAWLFPLLFPIAFLGSPVPTGSAEAGGVEARAVVEGQLAAFQRGDAEAAYAAASPVVKESVPNANSYMEIIKARYAAFFHQREVEFGTLAILGDEAAQGLLVVDDQDGVWVVVYILTRQSDGKWAVDNCQIASSDSTEN
jgi:hypothetical protein